METAAPAVNAQNIVKHYGERRVLDGLGFEVAASGSLVILGPSGCGKTTLLRVVAGLTPADAGEISLHGVPVSSGARMLVPVHRRGLGFVFQASALWPHMTVEQNIAFGIADMPKPAAIEHARDLMDRMSISKLAGKYPSEISGGEARRVALARALAPRPRLILMDEPLTNLDTGLKNELLDCMLEAIAQTDAALLYVTHDRDEAEKISSNRLVLGGDDRG